MNRYLDRWGWLFLKFKDEKHFYWELIIFARKICIVIVAKFLTNRPVSSMPLQTVIGLVSLYLQYRFSPYVDDCPPDRIGKWDSNANNRLEVMFLFGEIILFIGQFIHGIMVSNNKTVDQTALDEGQPFASTMAIIFEWLGIISLFLSMAYFLAVHIYHKILKRKEKAKRKKVLELAKNNICRTTMNPLQQIEIEIPSISGNDDEDNTSDKQKYRKNQKQNIKNAEVNHQHHVNEQNGQYEGSKDVKGDKLRQRWISTKRRPSISVLNALNVKYTKQDEKQTPPSSVGEDRNPLKPRLNTESSTINPLLQAHQSGQKKHRRKRRNRKRRDKSKELTTQKSKRETSIKISNGEDKSPLTSKSGMRKSGGKKQRHNKCVKKKDGFEKKTENSQQNTLNAPKSQRRVSTGRRPSLGIMNAVNLLDKDILRIQQNISSIDEEMAKLDRELALLRGAEED
eukprot:g1299.t1